MLKNVLKCGIVFVLRRYEMKKFFEDFKKFISRGNVIDMSIGVIIGGAFSAIVTSLTNKIIMPLINLLLSLGGENGMEKAYTFLKTVYDSNNEIDLAKSIYIDWGAFITAVIDFILIAFVLFLIIKTVMRASNIIRNANEELTNKDKKEERKAVRKQAKLENRPFKQVWAEYQANKQKELEEKQKQEAEEQARKENEEKLAHPSEAELLLQIRNLLQEQANNKN